MGADKTEQWYTNKEIYEMVRDLREELKDTRDALKAYNGIRDDLNWCIGKLKTGTAKREGMAVVLFGLRDWAGWAVAIILVLFKIFG